MTSSRLHAGLRRRACLLAACCAALALPTQAQTLDYPSKPIKLIVPNPPGGVTDLLGRIVSERLAALYGQPVVVDNRAGASGHLGAQQVAKSPADGYTLLLGTIGIHAAHASYRKLGYDPAAELVPVTILAQSPNVVLVPEASPLRSFADLLARARTDPASLNYATAGPGSSVHMVTALFETTSGAKVNYVPYKGSGPAMVDLIGGQVQVMFENLPSAIPHIQSGRVRALAVTGDRRDPRLPAVPTIAESGLPDYAAFSWFTVAAPRGTPQPLIDKLARDLKQVMAGPEVVAQLDKLGATLVLGSPEQAQQFFRTETAKWNRVIQATRLQLD
ncbi:tripartite tricarboxylate transporter substrate binding protein [Variovorax sp. J2P1-59]|uniref:Bug family tripartite tricarboxylate transporter substrate binding protein n=1 Tax=Variovorax flavidus TaxID=3053501 RepID=UPI0025756BF1|nr:tripartite tricarboxylate transporter substrate binding protein [Variovorax sp. J2P1-59]MDM0074447.1 tripartite tricarboxylate transporter substrate binding protein [Variovorax sp. J2P1-59]